MFRKQFLIEFFRIIPRIVLIVVLDNVNTYSFYPLTICETVFT